MSAYTKENIALGQRIKDIRTGRNIYLKNYNQKQFSELINSTVSALSNWENGRNKPNDSSIRKIANLANVSVSYLLNTTSLSDYTDEELVQEVQRRSIRL